ncbi:hypothetical protein K227x_64460 [Rubripirellula lacrimiformis]|uniref:Uncharacterized protein n=1 Tax=Rubripirellula lacrimiformis TaxID=1930273 RepID=A0A517NLK6_9BACT|nr:hypothetical protein K227x_64460 [Rubripirellula lacrimiformis]
MADAIAMPTNVKHDGADWQPTYQIKPARAQAEAMTPRTAPSK